MIFVTGGTGLIGSHLLYRLLEKGERVKALCRKESNTAEVKKVFSYYSEHAGSFFSKIEWVEGDLLDLPSFEDAMQGATHVYHCGAIVSFDPNNKTDLLQNNLTGTANLLAAAQHNRVQKLCYLSSVAALGTSLNGAPITENTHWNEQSVSSAYALSKYLAEKEVWRAAEEGLDAVIVNPGIVIGPGNWKRSSGRFFEAANRGIKWYTGGGMAYVDVRDVVSAMISLMESPAKNEQFIVAAENLSFKKFMEMVHASLGKPLPDRKAGRFMLELIWRLEKLVSILAGSEPVLTKETARYARVNLSYSNAKITEALQMAFIPMEESVRHASKHFISEHSDKK